MTKDILPCWDCGKAVALEASVCPHCGDPLPTRGTLGGAVPVTWKVVLSMADTMLDDADMMAKAGERYGLSPDQLKHVVAIMRERSGS